MRQEVVPGLEAALAQAQQMQQQLLLAQQKIAEASVQGQAGGGLVTVTLNGNGKVTAVQIDPKVVDPADVETLQDLIVGALADAADEMTELVKGFLGPLAELRQPPMQPPAGS
ncbi:MAG: YbaB/EbfC family nucleoid-associated protein [Mycobacteriaceae bacterium]